MYSEPPSPTDFLQGDVECGRVHLKGELLTALGRGDLGSIISEKMTQVALQIFELLRLKNMSR